MIFNVDHHLFDLDTAQGLADAVDWVNTKLTAIPEGGFWLVPRSGSKYEVDRAKHTVRRVYGLFDEIAIERAIKAARWTFIDVSVMK